MGLVRVALFFLRVITSFTIINLLKCSLVVTLAVVSLLRFRFDLFTIFAPTKFFRPFILRFARSFSLLFMLCVFFFFFCFYCCCYVYTSSISSCVCEYVNVSICARNWGCFSFYLLTSYSYSDSIDFNSFVYRCVCVCLCV